MSASAYVSDSNGSCIERVSQSDTCLHCIDLLILVCRHYSMKHSAFFDLPLLDKRLQVTLSS